MGYKNIFNNGKTYACSYFFSFVTFGRFEVHENNYELDVTTPKIEGLLNKELEERLNKEFADNADEVIKAFENDIIDMSKEYGDNNFHLSVIADYEVKTDNENLLALDFYIINTQASAVTKHCYYNIDKKSGDLITLASLFKDNSDYVTPISNYISHEMKKQNADGTGSYFIDEECGFEQISEQQNFYINNQGNIVICFDEYEVASGVQGSPEFEIPENIVESILK